MKKLIFLCAIILSFWSCSVNDDNGVNYSIEFLPVEEVVIPQEFKFDSIYQIDVSYYKPSTCYQFHDFYYVPENEVRTIAVINKVFENVSCTQQMELVENSFDFKVKYNQTYVFKFWQGEDETGEDIYLTYEIPVVE
jgi:hypothetical protein